MQRHEKEITQVLHEDSWPLDISLEVQGSVLTVAFGECIRDSWKHASCLSGDTEAPWVK